MGGIRLIIAIITSLSRDKLLAVAIEVGLQNAGTASGLAFTALQSSDSRLAPAIFGPWMNASGSVLASFWRRRKAA